MKGYTRLLIESGLSQSKLSKELGINKSSIQKYIEGKREPSLSKAILIADYFNIKDLRKLY